MVARRLFNKRTIGVFFVILLLACFLFIREQEENKRKYYEENQITLMDWCREYNEVIKRMRTVPEADYMGVRAEYREEHEGELGRLVGIDLVTCIRYLQGYSQQIEGVIEAADEALTLKMYADKSSQGYYNIVKTRYDYKKMRNISVVPTMAMGYDQVYGFKIAGFILLGVGLITGILCANEGKEQLWGLMYSLPGGRLRTSLKNCGALYLFSLGFTFLLYLALFGIAFYIYGGAECLFDTVQSNPSYASCHWRINNLEYMLLFVFCVATALFLVILLTSLLTAWRRSVLSGVLLMGLLLAVQLFLYGKQGFNHVIRLWNVANIFAFLMPDRILGRYYNIGNASMLVNQEYLVLVCLLGITVLCAAGYIAFTAVQKPVAAKKGGWAAALIRKGADRIGMWVAHWPLAIREIWRLLWSFGGILALFVLVLAVSASKVYVGVNYTENEAMALECLEMLKGKNEEEAEEYLEELKERLEAAYSYYEEALEEGGDSWGIGRAQEQIIKLEYITDHISKQYAYVQAHWNENVYYVNQYVYEALWKGQLDRHEQLVWCICMVCSFILSASVFPYDKNKGMKKLYITTPRGRKRLIRLRRLALGVICLSAVMIVQIMDLKNICEVYNIPLSDFSLSVRSILVLADCPLNITIGMLWIAILILRFLFLWLFVLISMNLSVICGTAGAVAALFAALFPFILNQMGVALFDKVSCVRILTENCGLSLVTSWETLVLLVLLCTAFLVTAVYTKKRWSCIDR